MENLTRDDLIIIKTSLEEYLDTDGGCQELAATALKKIETLLK